ncbi:MAG: transglutaminase family protein [Verrucomicrobiae bacterium]|nr:transglutaminase family protein [Verrucomicrobiae bacterium]
MARYGIQHKTLYRYNYPVSVSHHTARLTPMTNVGQTCESFNLLIYPDSADIIQRMDYFGNQIHFFSVQQPHTSLTVESRSQVYVSKQPVDLGILHTPCGAIRDALMDTRRADLLDAKQFLYPTEVTPDNDDVFAFATRFLKDEVPIGDALQKMLDIFHKEFEFDPEATEVSTPVVEVLAERKGVCQDFAHLALASLRSWGLSGCYVSGYILTEPPEGKERLVGADASHAWISVCVPEFGWVELDPTNRKVCGQEHVRVAQGRDYTDVSMLSGAVTGGGRHSIKVEVTMIPVETP